MKSNRGDVVLVLFPDSNQRTTLADAAVERILGAFADMTQIDAALRYTLFV